MPEGLGSPETYGAERVNIFVPRIPLVLKDSQILQKGCIDHIKQRERTKGKTSRGVGTASRMLVTAPTNSPSSPENPVAQCEMGPSAAAPTPSSFCVWNHRGQNHSSAGGFWSKRKCSFTIVLEHVLAALLWPHFETFWLILPDRLLMGS